MLYYFNTLNCAQAKNHDRHGAKISIKVFVLRLLPQRQKDYNTIYTKNFK